MSEQKKEEMPEKSEQERLLEARLETNIGKMEHDVWPNLVLMKDGYWFVAEALRTSCRVGTETYLEFDLAQDVHYQFLKNRYEIGKCLNGTGNLRPSLSVNSQNILSIQQFEG